MAIKEVVTKIFGMFDKVDDIVYEPIHLVCDILKQPLKQIETHNEKSKIEYEQELKKQLKKFETDLELDKKEREMKMTMEQRRIEEEINQMVLDSDLARREDMIQLEVKYRKEMAGAVAQLAQIMADIQVETRNKILALYQEKQKDYLDLQDIYIQGMFKMIKELKETFPDGTADDIMKEVVYTQLKAITENSIAFSNLMNEDMKKVFGIIDDGMKEMQGLTSKYFQLTSNQPVLTQNIINSIEEKE